jgi:hypothetical protein
MAQVRFEVIAIMANGSIQRHDATCLARGRELFSAVANPVLYKCLVSYRGDDDMSPYLWAVTS